MKNQLKAYRCLFFPILVSLAAFAPARADEQLKDIACRSVHLQYAGDEGIVFYNEIMIEESAPGTYFCVCGFNHGYFGLQELADGKRLLIFSVWDPGPQNDPNSVATKHRVQLIDRDELVRVGRFGGEGTGGQSFFDFDWQPNVRYRLLVIVQPTGNRTEFSGWFFLPDEKTWKKLVTFSTITRGKPLAGCYSFVEDFRRNRESTRHVRRAEFGNGWVSDKAGEWHSLDKATFTADSNPASNIDAGCAGGNFFLATGGATKNLGAKLNEPIVTSKTGDAQPPGDLPSFGQISRAKPLP